MADSEIVDPFAQVNAAATQPDVVDPFAPGYVAPRGFVSRGITAGTKGLKASAGGVAAATGEAVGSDQLRQYGLNVAKAASEEVTNPAEGPAPSLAGIQSLGDVADYIKYGVGYAIPNAGAALAAGLVGRTIGGTLAKGVANAGEAMFLKNAGSVAGLQGSQIAQEIGNIYPEAVENKTDNPLASSVAGGIAAGTVGTIPETYIAARLGLLGKGLAGGGASNIALNALKEAGIAGTGGAAAAAAQRATERLAVGKPLGNEEANEQYIEAAGLGAVGGAAGGGIAGLTGKGHAAEEAPRPLTQPEEPARAQVQEATTPAAEPAPAEAVAPEQPITAEKPLGLDIPAEQMELTPKPAEVSETEQKYITALDRQKELNNRLIELDTEEKAPADERRPKQEIKVERNAVLDELGGQDANGNQHGLYAKINSYEALLHTPEYQSKGELTEGHVLTPAEQTAKPQAIITPEEHEILLQAAKELPHATEQVGQQVLGGTEHQNGSSSREATETGGRNSTQRAAEGAGGISSDEAFTAQVARIKQSRGKLLNEDEARALRRAPAPDIQVEASNPREAFKQATPEAAREFILDSGEKLAAQHIQELQTNGLIKSDKSADTIRSGFNKAVRDMLSEKNPADAKNALEDGILRTLKGKIIQMDAQTIADHYVDTLMKQRQNFVSNEPNKPLSNQGTAFYSKAATQEDNRIANTLAEHADVVHEAHLAAGGSSTNLVTGQDLSGTHNYAVSPYKEREVVIPGKATPDQIREYIKANSDLLNNPDHMLGTWYNEADGHSYLDVSMAVPDLEQAKQIGLDAGQLAVFNLRDFSTISLEGDVPTTAESRAAVATSFDRIMTHKGNRATAYLDRIIGNAPNLEVRTVEAVPGQGAGMIRLTPYKDIIELAVNAKDQMSVAAHEGYHYLEFRVLKPAERTVVSNQFKPGTAVFDRLIARATAYDATNGTKLVDEIRAVPAEARAYGFEFWRRGELDAPTALGRAWDKIKQMVERVGNVVQGLGFQTYDDVFGAIDRGRYAKEGGNPFRTLHLENEPIPQDATALMSRSALEDLALRSKNGEVQNTQLHGRITDMLDHVSTPEGLKERLFRNGSNELKGVFSSLKRGYFEFSSGLNIARQSAGYKNVFDVLTTFDQRKKRIIADSVDNRLSSWIRGASDTDKRATSAALLERTVGNFTQASGEYKNIYSALTDKQRTMFDQATDMIAHNLDAEYKAEQVSYARVLGADSDAYKEWVASRGAQVDQLKNNGYFPERRYGDHIIHSYIETEDGKKLTLYYTQHEREADARSELPQIQRAFASDPLVKTEYGYKYKADYNGSISMQQFLDLASRNGISLEQSEKERLAKALISADSTRRNRIFRRQNIVGYSDSGLRILAEHGVAMANKIAYAELGGPMQDAMSGKVVETKFNADGTATANTIPGSNSWANDGEMAGFYRGHADRLADFIMSPKEGSKLSTGLRAAASIQFLGGSISAGVVQLTSVPMNTIPWLTQHTSYTDALGKTVSGFKLAMQYRKELGDIAKLMDKSVRLDGIDEIPGLRAALTTAAQDGTTLDTEIHQIMGIARGQEYSLSSKSKMALDAWMLPFRVSESLNRLSTFIAAYKVAADKNLDPTAAYKLAQDTVHGTQFRYDAINRPAFARGDVGSLLFSMRSFPIFVTESIVHLAKEKPSAAVAMLFSLGAVSGIEGMPFAEDIEDLIDTISYRLFNSPFNSKRALKNVLKSASEAITGADLSGVGAHGIANELTGMQFASRIGLGNIIPGTRLGAVDADYKSVVQDVIGPVGSMVYGVLKGVDSLSQGQYVDAMKQALPLAAQNFIKGAQQYQQGFATDLGGRKLINVSGMESFSQALGFSSTALSKAYEADKIDKQTLSFYQNAKQQFMTELTKAAVNGDKPRLEEATRAIESWNKNNPQFPLAFSPDSVRKELGLAGLPLNERTFLKLPKILRGNSESAIGLDTLH